MAPPWTNAQGVASWHMSGAGLPHGAVFTTGLFFLDDPEDLLDRLQLGWESLRTVMCSTVTCDEIRLKRGPAATGPTYTRGVGQAGALANTQTDPQVSVLVRKVCEDVSGRFYGRMYLPGLAENQTNVGGVITPTARDNWQAAVTGWRVAIQGPLDSPLYVLSRSSSDPRTVINTPVDARVATQRRRNRR